MTKVMPDELRALSKYIHASSGIALDESKAYLVEGRLGRLLGEFKCGTYGELYFRAKSDSSGQVRRKIIDAITTGETSFFRDSAPFDLLRHKLLPELVDRRKATTRPGAPIPIRIWSAACSTGQEVYSIAIVLTEVLGNLDKYSIRLLGTDISDKAVATASKGIYGRIEMDRGLAGGQSLKYFEAAGKDQWKVRDEIRALATFRQINLMEDLSAVGRFDIVFCRNVAIYFSDADRASMFTRMGRVMERDGALVIGSTESLATVCPQYESKRHLRSVFYQHRLAA